MITFDIEEQVINCDSANQNIIQIPIHWRIALLIVGISKNDEAPLCIDFNETCLSLEKWPKFFLTETGFSGFWFVIHVRNDLYIVEFGKYCLVIKTY